MGDRSESAYTKLLDLADKCLQKFPVKDVSPFAEHDITRKAKVVTTTLDGEFVCISHESGEQSPESRIFSLPWTIGYGSGEVGRQYSEVELSEDRITIVNVDRDKDGINAKDEVTDPYKRDIAIRLCYLSMERLLTQAE